MTAFWTIYNEYEFQDNPILQQIDNKSPLGPERQSNEISYRLFSFQ